MTELTRQKIFEKLQLLDKYFSYLEKLKKEIKSEKEFLSDFHFFGLAERYLQLSLQVIIDILDLIIIEEQIKKPEERREIISLLFNKGILSEKLASKLDGIVGLRNILVHEYGEIDRKRIYKYLRERTKDFQIFKKEILNWLKQKD
jgi:uncharacterized protein YutE (UPF0331/DUF86 family)